MKKIGILGAGNVGAALGGHWVKAGYQVQYGVREKNSPKVEKLLAQQPDAILAGVEAVLDWADVIVLTVPAMVVPDLAPLFKTIAHKPVIDATNMINGLVGGTYPTALHALKDLAGVQDIVKCFNSTGFENQLNPMYHLPDGSAIGLDMFVAGDAKNAKSIAQELSLAAGFATCYDFGGDDKVKLLEQFALSWINLAIMQGHGRNLGFKLLKR